VVVERIDVEGVFKDEISSRLDNVLSTMVEFGSTTEQVARAQEMLSQASADGARGVAQMTNVLRTMVDESEDADKAMQSVGLAFDVAAAAGLKAEDAGRELGKMFKGDTAILKKFDATAKRAAEAIDKIRDPAKRAELGMRALRQATARQNSTLGKAKTRITEFNAKLSMMGLGANPLGAAVKGVAVLGAGMLALGAAVSGVVIASMVKFAQSQEESAFAVASLSTRLDELQIAFGKAMLGADSASSAVQRIELVVAEMTTEVNDSASGLNMIFKATVRVIEALLLAAIQETHQQFRNLTAAIDVIQITLFRFTQNLSLAASALDQVIRRINAVVDSNALASFSDGVRRISMELESDAPTLYTMQLDHAANSVTHFTSRMADALVGTQALNDELSAMKAAQKATRGVIKTAKDVKTRGRRGGGGGRRKGPQVPAWMQVEIDKAQLMYETWKEETTQAENRPLGAMADTMGSDLGATMPIITAQVAALKAEIDALNAAAAASNKVWTDLANGGISLAFESISGMTQALIEGGDALQAFGAGLLASLGDLLTQAGMAFVMMGTGVENIKLGITAPGALIAIGVGMLALGGALKGFATRAQPGGGGGGDGGKTAQALQRFGRQLFDRQMGQESKNVMINIEGRQMRGYVLDVASDGLRTGSIPLTPVRRR